MSACAVGPTADYLRVRCDRRGRGAVLWGLAGVLLLQAAFYPLNHVWPQLHDGEYGGKLSALRALMAAKPREAPSVVMVGGSLTSWGFNPSALTSVKPRMGGPVVYNFGINNGRAVVQLLCVRRLLADGVRPDLMLVDTFPWCFYQGESGFDGQQYFARLRIQGADLPVFRRYHDDPRAVSRDWRELCWAPWYSYRRNLQRYYLPDWTARDDRLLMWWNMTDGNGWEYIPSHVAAMRAAPHEFLVGSVMYHVQGMNQAPIDDDRFPRVYREMAETCARAGVPMMLVRMPEFSLLRRGLSPAVRTKIDAIFDDLRREAGVRVIDARDWADDDMFVDGFHLNRDGSTQFTRRLEREVLDPCVFRPSQGLASSR